MDYEAEGVNVTGIPKRIWIEVVDTDARNLKKKGIYFGLQ